MSIVIALMNEKGGAGKTTTTLNLAKYYSNQGYKVLTVDIDPQRNTSTSLAADVRPEGCLIKSAYTVDAGSPIESDFDEKYKSLVLKNLKPIPINDNHHLLCSSHALDDLVNGKNPMDVLYCLKNALEVIIENYKYDLIFIDTNPAPYMLTKTAMVAADKILIPMSPTDHSADGLKQLVTTILTVKRSYNPTLEILGISINRYRSNTKEHTSVLKRVKNAYGDMVFNSTTRESIDMEKTKKPYNNQKEISSLSRSEIAIDYLKFYKEFSKRADIKDIKKLKKVV